MGTDRRSRSRVRVRIAGSASLAWVQVLDEWGAYVEAVVEDIPQSPKDIRCLVTSTTPPITTSQALLLEPQGPWNGCIFTHVQYPKDTLLLASTLIKRWRPAIAVISLGASMTRSEALSCLPSDLPPFYHKRMITCHHAAVGGVTSAVRRFVHYTRWEQVLSWPSLMMSNILPRTLQTALSNTYSPSAGGYFEAREGMLPPEAVGLRMEKFWHDTGTCLLG